MIRRHLQIVADVGVAAWEAEKAERGITPAVEKQFAAAARAIRKAIDQVEKANALAEPDSDADLSCGEAIKELHGVLWHVEPKP
jgi:hypothetical protein